MWTEEQEHIRDAVRDFAKQRLAPGAARRDVDHAFPRAELAEMGALGFLGMLVSSMNATNPKPRVWQPRSCVRTRC